LDDTQKLDRLIDYSFFSFQNTDLADLLQKSREDEDCNPFRNLRKNSNVVDKDVQGCFLGYLTLNDATYLMYAYKYRGKEYGFAWETYYDETHRAFDMEAESSWYDFIEQGQFFRIRIKRSEPEVHFISERPFNIMNGTVIRLGPCREF